VLQTAAVGFQLGFARPLPLPFQEHRLDEDRPTASGGQQVVEDALEGDLAAADLVVVRLGARVELGPHFALMGHQGLQPLDNVWSQQAAGIRNEHELHQIQSPPPLEAGHPVHHLREFARRGGLAVPAEGDVIDATLLWPG
jgi:hypothetical protein